MAFKLSTAAVNDIVEKQRQARSKMAAGSPFGTT
jgi:hypothetical protein